MAGTRFWRHSRRILDAWRRGFVTLVVSPTILHEYRRVGEELAAVHEGIDLSPFLSLLTVHAEIIDAPALPSPVCSDRDDDKFIACALAGRVSIVVSGDKALLAVNGDRGVSVLRPREFLTRHLHGPTS